MAVTPAQRRQRQLAPIKTGVYVRAESGLRLRSRKVRRLVTKMRAEMPWLAPADLPACRAWAELELLGARAFVELEANGVTNAKGEPRRLLGDFRALRQAQVAYERELGMTPASRMTLRVGDSRARSLDVVASCAVTAANGGAAGETNLQPARPRRRAGGPSLYAALTARIAQRHAREVASHPVDLAEAARILGVGADGDWLKHHGEEVDRYGAAIRMGGGRISGYDVAGLLRWRKARTGPARR